MYVRDGCASHQLLALDQDETTQRYPLFIFDTQRQRKQGQIGAPCLSTLKKKKDPPDLLYSVTVVHISPKTASKCNFFNWFIHQTSTFFNKKCSHTGSYNHHNHHAHLRKDISTNMAHDLCSKSQCPQQKTFCNFDRVLFGPHETTASLSVCLSLPPSVCPSILGIAAQNGKALPRTKVLWLVSFLCRNGKISFFFSLHASIADSEQK
jgi:hypothetical protein